MNIEDSQSWIYNRGFTKSPKRYCSSTLDHKASDRDTNALEPTRMVQCYCLYFLLSFQTLLNFSSSWEMTDVTFLGLEKLLH